MRAKRVLSHEAACRGQINRNVEIRRMLIGRELFNETK